MDHISGFGHAALNFGSRSPERVTEPKNQKDDADRLQSQSNILKQSEQQNVQAVSPIEDALASENNAKKPLSPPEKPGQKPSQLEGKEQTKSATSTKKQEETSKTENGEELTEEEEQQVKELQQRDTEVRAHEQAHSAAGGSYAGAPSYEFTTGPDNKQYAVSGEVEIDSAPIPNNPQATIAKMQVVIRAALSPADPSSQDIKVATNAQKALASAQAELAKKSTSEEDEKDDPFAIEDSEADTNETNPIQTQSNTAQEIFTAILAYKSVAAS